MRQPVDAHRSGSFESHQQGRLVTIELLGQLRERDGRVREALVAVLTGASPRLLAAVGTLMDFVG
jgi:hypothetical protein